MENLWAPWRLQYISRETIKKEGCVFCAVIAEQDDPQNHIVFRGKHCYVILNKYPYNNGHVMIVPYRHESDLLELSAEIQNECQQLINKTVKALRLTLKPNAFNIGLNLGKAAGAGIEEHIHYHVLPRWEGDTNFMPVLAGVKVISESLESTYKALSAAFKELEK